MLEQCCKAMAAKRNVSFQGVPSLFSSEGFEPAAASLVSSKEFQVLSSVSNVTSTEECDPAPSLTGSAPSSGDSAQLSSEEEQTLTASSVASSDAAHVRDADSGSRSSSAAAADSVSVPPSSGTHSPAPRDKERSARCINVSLLAFLAIFLAACATAIFVDRKWNVFAGDAPLPAAADGVAESAAADPASAKLRAAATAVAGRTTEARPSSTTKGTVSATAATTPPSKKKKARAAVRERATTSADMTTERGAEDDSTSDDTDYKTMRKHRTSRPATARSGRKAHTPHQHRPPARPECGTPLFTPCSKPRREFYYRPEADACTEAGGSSAEEEPKSSPPLCNRSPNRFGSLESCRRSCTAATMPAQRCFDKPLFAACSRQLVSSAWWSFDGRRCLPWQFPEGHCPDPGHVFRTRAQCNRECSTRRAHAGARSPTSKPSQRCRPPSRLACGARQLRFPYFADMSHRGRVHCFLVSEESVLRAQRCLVGPNRHRSLGQCLATCVQRRHRAVRTRYPRRDQERPALERRWRSQRHLH